MPPEFFVVVLFLKYGVGLVQGVKSRGGFFFFFFFLVLLAVEPALKVTVSLALQMALVTSVPPSPTR